MICRRPLLFILIIASLLVSMLAWGDTSAHSTNQLPPPVRLLYVKPGETGDCSSWATACDLQIALTSYLSPGDAICAAAGIYKPTSDTNRENSFQLISGVDIYGGFPPGGGEWSDRDPETHITMLSGDIGVEGNASDNSYHVVTAISLPLATVLDGITITGGYAYESPLGTTGGGLYNNNSNLVLNHVMFTANSATKGGGMANFESNPVLTNVTFQVNSAQYGGGMYNLNSNPILDNVPFNNNVAMDSGAGMTNDSSNPTLTNVIFTSNYSNGDGGGMYNSESNPILTDVAFTENTAVQNGGGLVNLNSSPTLTNVTFTQNISHANGGGMHNSNSNPTLIMVTFDQNSAYGVTGGGMANRNNSNPILTNVIFRNNVAKEGGGLHSDFASPTLFNVTFTSNNARYGGGMRIAAGSATLTNVTFNSNSASIDGGGIYIDYNGTPTLTNVTFTNNDALRGGGMFSSTGSPTLTNGTFTYNTAAYGGGIYNKSSTLTLTNAIIWGNLPEQIYCDETPIVTYSDVEGGYSGEGNIDIDPLLGPLANNGGFTQTQALGEGSPAIDSGNPSFCPSTDQRGFYRPIDGDGDGIARCDMGAYEYGSSIVNEIFLPMVFNE